MDTVSVATGVVNAGNEVCIMEVGKVDMGGTFVVMEGMGTHTHIWWVWIWTSVRSIWPQVLVKLRYTF